MVRGTNGRLGKIGNHTYTHMRFVATLTHSLTLEIESIGSISLCNDTVDIHLNAHVYVFVHALMYGNVTSVRHRN